MELILLTSSAGGVKVAKNSVREKTFSMYGASGNKIADSKFNWSSWLN